MPARCEPRAEARRRGTRQAPPWSPLPHLGRHRRRRVDHPRRADRARFAERAGEVADDGEDEAGALRATGGGATARDEAGAAVTKLLSDMVVVGSL